MIEKWNERRHGRNKSDKAQNKMTNNEKWEWDIQLFFFLLTLHSSVSYFISLSLFICVCEHLLCITWETRSTVRTLRHRLTERRCWKIPIDKIVVDKRDKTLKMFHKTLEIKHNYILRARQTHKTEIHATLLVCLCLLQSEGWETLLSNIFCV